MQYWLWGLTVAFYSIAASSGGINTAYFWTLRQAQGRISLSLPLRRRRRLSVWVLTSLCLALSLESAYAGMHLLAAGPGHSHPATGLGAAHCWRPARWQSAC